MLLEIDQEGFHPASAKDGRLAMLDCGSGRTATEIAASPSSRGDGSFDWSSFVPNMARC